MTDANAPCGLFYCGGRCWFRVTGLTMVYLVRIVPTSAAKPPAFPRKNEGSEATLTTHKTTHQGARQRTRRRSMCKHARAWTCRKAKATGQICEKPWENQGFAAERTGTEQPAKSLGKSKFKNEAAQNPTRAAKHFVRCLLHARAATLSWTQNRLLAHPHITGSFTRSHQILQGFTRSFTRSSFSELHFSVR